MALIEGFRATNVWKAFTLNAIVASLVIFIAMMVKSKLDKYTDKNGDEITRTTTWKSTVLTLLVTFATTFTAYTIMHFLFDFGGGMEIS